MKKILQLFCLVFVYGLAVRAQEKLVLYVDVNGTHVSSMDSAYVIREVDQPKQGSLFTFTDFYKANRKVKMSGAGYFFNGVIKFHGDFVLYNLEGAKAQELSFEHGQNTGVINEYDKNGRLYKKFERIKIADEYSFDRTFAAVNEVPDCGYYLYKTHYLVDTLGKKLIDNGKGYLVEKLNYLGEDFIAQGNYVNGLRDGLWTGKSVTGAKLYKEYYKKGILEKGTLFLDGKAIKYSTLFTAPDYKYTNNHIAHRYLEDAGFYQKYIPKFKKGTRGDYYVSVTLSVSEKGDVDEVIFEKTLNNKEVETAITKALLGMPKWKPAILRGVNARAKYQCLIPYFKVME